jgi:hypothetical protein
MGYIMYDECMDHPFVKSWYLYGSDHIKLVHVLLDR